MDDKPANCETTRDRIPDWLTNELSDAERMAFDAHLSQCPDCRQEVSATRQVWQRMGHVPVPKPGPQVSTRFYAMLDSFETEESIARPATPAAELVETLSWLRQWLTSPIAMRLAYSVLLLGVGVGAGYWLPRRQESAVAYQARIDTLSVQVQEMRQMMMLSLLENPSATERLRAVGYTKDIPQADSPVIDALLTTLNNDPNVNVRLVTLEALADLASDARVREGLVQSLMHQESPLVQVALADVMVKLQEKRSLKPLRQLLRQQGINSLVKTKLEMTIRELS